MFTNKTLLITGGTGSFGHAVMERLLMTDIREIRIFSRDEKKQDDMRKKFTDPRLKFYIGDVRQVDSIKHAMYGVNYVFHAAALKQVPSCEFFPLEAVKTNVLGTENVLTTAIDCGVEKIICLSTDKAAYPINAMGISKAMMEKVFVAKANAVAGIGPIICGTRYGNVLASRGSVIPLFIEQIKKKQPLTITEPHMTRFLMSLHEAVELVLFAFEHGEAGDIFVQKAPAATIGDVAEALQQLFHAQEGIEVIGMRHGEKQYETLLTKEECIVAKDLGNFYKVPSDKRALNYSQYYDNGNVNMASVMDYNSDITNRLTVEEIKQLLRQQPYIEQQLSQFFEHTL